jgi:hypothetical protein
VTLDPDFDFIDTATGFLTERGYRQAGARRAIESGGEQLRASATSAVRIPPKLESLLDDFDRKAVTLTADLEDSNDVLRRFAKRLIYGLFAAVGLLSTALLYADGEFGGTVVAAGLTVVVLFLLRRSFQRRSGVTARPQFTRQNLRAQREEGGGRLPDTDSTADDRSTAVNGTVSESAGDSSTVDSEEEHPR